MQLQASHFQGSQIELIEQRDGTIRTSKEEYIRLGFVSRVDEREKSSGLILLINAHYRNIVDKYCTVFIADCQIVGGT